MHKSDNAYASAAELGLMEGFPPPEEKCVNRSNALLTPPYNRWAYLHMRTIYPSAGVPNANQPVPIEKSIREDIIDISIAKPDDSGQPSGGTVSMDTFLKETYTDALVVVKRDQIVFEKFFNGMTPLQPHQMMSVTKSFTGLFGLIAVDNGHIAEDDLVVKYIPELEASGAFRNATVGQVLNMTNAMIFDEGYADPASDIRQYGVVLGLMEPVEGVEYANSIYDYLLTLRRDLRLEHGQVFNYQTPKTDVVNWITNRATGASFQDDFYNKLWSKLGTEGETYVLLDKNGTLFAGGGLNAPPYDLARFTMMMLNDGVFNGQQVVSSSVIEKIAAGASRKAFSRGSEAHGIQAGGDWSYRAQWWVRHTPGKEAFTAMGIHGQYIYFDLSRDIAIIKQSSQPESATDYYTAYDILGFDAIIAHLNKL